MKQFKKILHTNTEEKEQLAKKLKKILIKDITLINFNEKSITHGFCGKDKERLWFQLRYPSASNNSVLTQQIERVIRTYQPQLSSELNDSKIVVKFELSIAELNKIIATKAEREQKKAPGIFSPRYDSLQESSPSQLKSVDSHLLKPPSQLVFDFFKQGKQKIKSNTSLSITPHNQPLPKLALKNKDSKTESKETALLKEAFRVLLAAHIGCDLNQIVFNQANQNRKTMEWVISAEISAENLKLFEPLAKISVHSYTPSGLIYLFHIETSNVTKLSDAIGGLAEAQDTQQLVLQLTTVNRELEQEIKVTTILKEEKNQEQKKNSGLVREKEQPFKTSKTRFGQRV